MQSAENKQKQQNAHSRLATVKEMELHSNIQAAHGVV